jgi:hypothetical protein
LALNSFVDEMSTTGSGFDESIAGTRTFIMDTKLMGLLAGIAVLGGAAMLPAQEGANQTKAGEGTLIFVKPENGGSEVKMFTEGLAWDEK